MPIDRPFIDSKGTRGASYVRPIKVDLTSKSIKGRVIRFMVNNKETIMLTIPEDLPIRNISLTKRNGLRLAYWLLNNCQQEK